MTVAIKAGVSVLFVCTGNICRSPTAEGVMRHMVSSRGLSERILTASAGTHGYHVGNEPDRRAQAHALQRGYDLSAQRARQVSDEDFESFDHILAMDAGHLALLHSRCPPQQRHRLGLFTRHASRFKGIDEVPDPYYGGAAGFEEVLDYVEDACAGLLEALCVPSAA